MVENTYCLEFSALMMTSQWVPELVDHLPTAVSPPPSPLGPSSSRCTAAVSIHDRGSLQLLPSYPPCRRLLRVYNPVVCWREQVGLDWLAMQQSESGGSEGESDCLWLTGTIK
jgi:hypothetical protein